MLHRYFVAALVIAGFVPALAFAQTQNTGGTGATGGNANLGGTGNNTGLGGNGIGSFGNPNTTLLGSTVNLEFNSVFGTSATIANTNADPFAAYRPSETGTTSNTFSGGQTGSQGFAGTGQQRTGTGFQQGGTGLGRNQFGGAGLAGGQTGFNAGGINRGGAFGNQGVTFGGQGLNLGGLNRQGGIFGGQNFLGGGTSFLGGTGGGMNNQQVQSVPGYRYEFAPSESVPVSTPNSVATVNLELQQRLVAAPALQNAQNLQVSMVGDTAVLKGKVTSDAAKTLAAALLRLEPGVYQVDNQLEVVIPGAMPKPNVP